MPIIEELCELRDESLDYWSKSTTDETRDHCKQLENSLKGRLQSLIADLNYFRDARRLFPYQIANWLVTIVPKFAVRFMPASPGYILAILEVYEACTGDDFETESRQANPAKYFSICSNISKVRSELLRIKL